ncbi:MAG: LPXTG cell wall anchor domain-containing protein [Jiangellales bacterium]
MIRKTVALAVVGLLALVGLAPAASATYPPGTPTISCSPTSPVAGQAFTCTVTNFDDGTTVTFSWGAAAAAFGGFAFQDSGSTSATVSGGAASADVTINTPGTYTVTASGTSGGSPATASTTITVQAAAGTGTDTGGLPATGSSNTATLLAVAGGAVLLGGLALVGSRARRQTKGSTLV